MNKFFAWVDSPETPEWVIAFTGLIVIFVVIFWLNLWIALFMADYWAWGLTVLIAPFAAMAWAVWREYRKTANDR